MLRYVLFISIYLIASSCEFVSIARDNCSELFQVSDQQAVLVGGLAGLQKSLLYPQEVIDGSIQGRVIVKFIIDKSGRTKDHTITRSLSSKTDTESIRVIRDEAVFTPAINNNEPVCAEVSLPLLFRRTSNN